MPYINSGVQLMLDFQANELVGNFTGPLPDAASVYSIPNIIRIDLPGLNTPIVFENQDEIVLGRGGGASLSLPDFDRLVETDVPLVSRRHALIRRTDWGITVEDLSSTNGTWLNGLRLTPGETYILRNGDQLKLAEQFLFVYLSSSDQDNPAGG